jgi:hypothetical protein
VSYVGTNIDIQIMLP